MKIGIDCRLWNETGVGRYIRNLVENLQVLDTKNEYVLFVLSKDKSHINYPNWKIVESNVRWHSVDEQLAFVKLLNKEKLDLMHFPYFSVPVLYKRPFVVTIHDLIVEHHATGKASTLPLPVYMLKRLSYKYVLSQAVKNAQKLIVPLHTVKEDLIKTLRVAADRIVVTYEGVDERIKGKGGSGKGEPQSPYFLYVGNAYPHKNLERLIKAFEQVKKNNDIRLLLVGKKDYFYERLEERVRKEKLVGVEFRHDVSDEELSGLYSNAIALISPSLMEGFGLPPLEAMSVGSPILLSDIPSFKEVCKDAAFYFDPLSIEDIKEKMELLYVLNQQTRQEHIKRGLERVKHFSWEKMARETLGVYNSIK